MDKANWKSHNKTKDLKSLQSILQDLGVKEYNLKYKLKDITI